MKKIKNKIDKSISLAFAKKPDKVLILGIIVLNFILVFGAAALLVLLFPELSGGNFWKTAYNVFTMILDAGCISDIVTGKYENNAVLSVLCIVIIFIGTLIFTGAIIGYLSNRISNFIERANQGNRRLVISDHIIIINWNNRASEIINDLLYSDAEEKIVILVSKDKEKIELEIKNRIADTFEREKKKLLHEADELIKKGLLKKRKKYQFMKNASQLNKITVIVRQGEVYSLKQLNDISVATAKNIIILGNNNYNGICQYNKNEILAKQEKGNIETIKSLVQISQITSSEKSADNQKVVVEVEDDWTHQLVNKIIKHKERKGKCNIVPVPINKILGQILSQFSIMPELNSVYSELLSNKGATFYSRNFSENDEIQFITDYLRTHKEALPLTTMETDNGKELYYISTKNEHFNKKCLDVPEKIEIKLNNNFKFEHKHIAIVGHNSKSLDILEGFNAFVKEWGDNVVDILIIDDEEHLKKVNYYNEYRGENGKFSFIKKVVISDVYESETIQNTLNEYIDSHPEDTSVLILSDDNVPDRELDSNALTYLVYLQDIIYERSLKYATFDPESIDIIIELLNPKNYDVVRSYSVDNVIISNRYISRMMVQIGEKESIYEFYKDILTYDLNSNGDYQSKELYIKKAKEFFDSNTHYPIRTTPRNIVYSVYEESPEQNKNLILGIVKNNVSNMMFINSKDKTITIDSNDKLILFAPH